MLRFWAGVGSGEPDSISWAKPRIALSGVRSSWLMLDRKSDFARFAFSATAMALLQFQLDLLAHGIVGADQQVADDVAVIVAQRRDRHDGRKAAAILADVGQFVDVLDAARRLEGQGLEARA